MVNNTQIILLNVVPLRWPWKQNVQIGHGGDHGHSLREAVIDKCAL